MVPYMGWKGIMKLHLTNQYVKGCVASKCSTKWTPFITFQVNGDMKQIDLNLNVLLQVKVKVSR